MSVIPADWLHAAKMTRVHLHWTGGNHKASSYDKQHYHVLIEGDGTVIRGKPSITLNSPPTKPGYAAHTLGANSGAIGLSLCCMAEAIERPFKAGRAPLTKIQWDRASSAAAELCKRYDIRVTPKTVLSHAEVQANLGIRQKNKWDVAILPFDRAFDTARECGDRFRAEVAAKLGAMK